MVQVPGCAWWRTPARESAGAGRLVMVAACVDASEMNGSEVVFTTIHHRHSRACWRRDRPTLRWCGRLSLDPQPQGHVVPPKHPPKVASGLGELVSLQQPVGPGTEAPFRCDHYRATWTA